MNARVDLLIVGAGPAGMLAAITARAHGLTVTVVDEQPSPGGQIWRNIENLAGTSRADILGGAYKAGSELVERFRRCGAVYKPDSQVWNIEKGGRVFIRSNNAACSIDATNVLLATGAQERPMPFPGWTLPGVMTVGAAQIVLKSAGQLPAVPIWIAGNGPLPLLYAYQLLKAGGKIAGFLDTSRQGSLLSAVTKLPSAFLNAPADLLKGLAWLATVRRQVRYVSHVTALKASGTDSLRAITFTNENGLTETVETKLLFVHEGLVPTLHPTFLLGCRHEWNEQQHCFVPVLSEWGETSEEGIFVAGDSAGIGGAKAACLRGEIAALKIAANMGRITNNLALTEARLIRKKLARALASRPLLDSLYQPRAEILAPSDDTIVCRCEEITVADIREEARRGVPGPNQVKAYTRAGMGPCQGRQCGYTIANILAKLEGRPMSDVGLYRVRPPLTPLTLGELASLDAGANDP